MGREGGRFEREGADLSRRCEGQILKGADRGGGQLLGADVRCMDRSEGRGTVLRCLGRCERRWGRFEGKRGR